MAKCVSLLIPLLYNSTVLEQTLAKNVKFALHECYAYTCFCVPSGPLLSWLDGLFYFLACCAVMECYFAVLVLVLVLGVMAEMIVLSDRPHRGNAFFHH